MDRLETRWTPSEAEKTRPFIFQYGQIRNPLGQLGGHGLGDLYSSMDRLETFMTCIVIPPKYLFIFQYGQIRNGNMDLFGLGSMLFIFQYGQIRNKIIIITKYVNTTIYIPVWIDQKLYLIKAFQTDSAIYIPVWIDQKQTHFCQRR